MEGNTIVSTRCVVLYICDASQGTNGGKEKEEMRGVLGDKQPRDQSHPF